MESGRKIKADVMVIPNGKGILLCSMISHFPEAGFRKFKVFVNLEYISMQEICKT